MWPLCGYLVWILLEHEKKSRKFETMLLLVAQLVNMRFAGNGCPFDNFHRIEANEMRFYNSIVGWRINFALHLNGSRVFAAKTFCLIWNCQRDECVCSVNEVQLEMSFSWINKKIKRSSSSDIPCRRGKSVGSLKADYSRMWKNEGKRNARWQTDMRYIITCGCADPAA